MAILKKIIHILSTISYILILVYGIVCIPILFKYHPLVVLSGSMEPTYPVGSIIYYKEVPQSELKAGDAVTFLTKDNQYVSHRIVSINGDEVSTKGDANNTVDANTVKLSDIKGKIQRVYIPYLGYYVRFVNENLIIVVTSIVLILVSEFLFSNTGTFDINKKKGRSENDGRKE